MPRSTEFALPSQSTTTNAGLQLQKANPESPSCAFRALLSSPIPNDLPPTAQAPLLLQTASSSSQSSHRHLRLIDGDQQGAEYRATGERQGDHEEEESVEEDDEEEQEERVRVRRNGKRTTKFRKKVEKTLNKLDKKHKRTKSAEKRAELLGAMLLLNMFRL